MKPPYRERSLNGTMSQMIKLDMVSMPPLPMPWIARPRINTAVDGAAPQTALPMANSMIEVIITDRRPNKSEICAETRLVIVQVTKKALTAQMKRSREWSVDAIVCKAGDSMDMSRALRKDERQIEKMIIQNRISLGGALSCSELAGASSAAASLTREGSGSEEIVEADFVEAVFVMSNSNV